MNLNLNLIKALHALIDTSSVTQMGARLNLSQPAASRVMAKLREALADPLLVRTSKGYVLTPLAESLRDSVDEALHLAKNVFTQHIFAPDVSDRQFNVCTTDYGEAIVLQPLFTHLEEIAPRLSCHVVSWSENTLYQLENGVLDLALYADDALPADFHYRDLFVDQYALIVRRGHPLDGRIYVQLDDFLQDVTTYPQIATNFPQGRGFVLDDALKRLGASTHHITFTTPYFTNPASMVARSNHVMLLPKRMAQLFAQHLPIALIDVPSMQENFTYRMIWHERAHRDQGHKWLREQILLEVM